MNVNIKYLIHCLAFFCIPLIIIRGVNFVFSEQTTQNEVFTPVATSKTKVIWLGNDDLGKMFIFAPHSSSKELNQFNNEITNNLLQRKSLIFGYLYVANFTKNAITFDPKVAKVDLHFGANVFSNISLADYVNNRSLYVSFLLKEKKVPEKCVEKTLVAFEIKQNILDATKVELVWEEQKIYLRKVVCLRKQFYEFLENPKFDFFSADKKK